jgi:hypothetical protein
MWTLKDCFVGPTCWCGIIVNPKGEECNPYGELCKKSCQLIIDALNKTPGTEENFHERLPFPWHIEEFGKGERCIVTTDGIGKDDLEHTVSCVGSIFDDYDLIFVKAVNEFYNQAKTSLGEHHD